MTELSLRQVCKNYGTTAALHPIDLDVRRGEFVTILGPSGCGKSTLLRIISGITAPSSGEISLRGARIEALPPERRDIAMVFQSYALFPHMTVGRNLAFGLKMKRVPAGAQAERIAHAVEICRLGSLMDRMPRELSGGQQQRVALARAIVMQPALLLFDEPLSNLDAKLRDSLRHELAELHRRVGTTSLYVTHDQAEAMAMSDRIVLMNAGRVVEIGVPIDLYRRPARTFTAEFLGQTNLLTLEVQGREALLPWGARVPLSAANRTTVRVSIRPEDVAVAADENGAASIESVSFTGPQVNYTLRTGVTTLRATTSGGGAILQPGQRVSVALSSELHPLEEGMEAER
ncbi:ABC transporter ATP-binding protein [Variovorax sp. AFSI2.2]|uniref:ABC transporter ATP-binding protein n=1 Tax=Variovorax sp. AFSI2.2 TaxID=3384160 RepID=UPI003EB7B7BA